MMTPELKQAILIHLAEKALGWKVFLSPSGALRARRKDGCDLQIGDTWNPFEDANDSEELAEKAGISYSRDPADFLRNVETDEFMIYKAWPDYEGFTESDCTFAGNIREAICMACARATGFKEPAE